MFGQNYLFNTPQTSPRLTSTFFRLHTDQTGGAQQFGIKISINCSADNSILGPGSLCLPLNNLPSRLRETPSILIRQVSSLLNLGRKQTQILKTFCNLGRKRFLVGSPTNLYHSLKTLKILNKTILHIQNFPRFMHL